MLFFSKENNSQLTDMSITLNFCRQILGHLATTANVLFLLHPTRFIILPE